MLELKPVPPDYTHVLDIFALPEEHQEGLRLYGIQNEYACYNYHDGDYYLLLPFSYLQKDATAEEVVNLFAEHFDCEDEALAEQYDEDNYPYADWAKDSHLVILSDYLAWLKALRFIAANIPSELAQNNTVAVFVWH
jgi:hypothetical protein